jgi:hypothetical protein
MLQALSRYPAGETELVTEFAKRLNLRRWLLKIAGRTFWRDISGIDFGFHLVGDEKRPSPRRETNPALRGTTGYDL